MPDSATAPRIEVRRLRDPTAALGAALHFLGRRDPFASFSARDLITTVSGQVRRETYLLAFDGPRVVGYFGWAFLDAAAAVRFLRTRSLPEEALADAGDIVWLPTIAVTSRPALAALVRTARRLYPARRILGLRHRPDGPARLVDLRATHPPLPA